MKIDKEYTIISPDKTEGVLLDKDGNPMGKKREQRILVGGDKFLNSKKISESVGEPVSKLKGILDKVGQAENKRVRVCSGIEKKLVKIGEDLNLTMGDMERVASGRIRKVVIPGEVRDKETEKYRVDYLKKIKDLSASLINEIRSAEEKKKAEIFFSIFLNSKIGDPLAFSFDREIRTGGVDNQQYLNLHEFKVDKEDRINEMVDKLLETCLSNDSLEKERVTALKLLYNSQVFIQNVDWSKFASGYIELLKQDYQRSFLLAEHMLGFYVNQLTFDQSREILETIEGKNNLSGDLSQLLFFKHPKLREEFREEVNLKNLKYEDFTDRKIKKLSRKFLNDVDLFSKVKARMGNIGLEIEMKLRGKNQERKEGDEIIERIVNPNDDVVSLGVDQSVAELRTGVGGVELTDYNIAKLIKLKILLEKNPDLVSFETTHGHIDALEGENFKDSVMFFRRGGLPSWESNEIPPAVTSDKDKGIKVPYMLEMTKYIDQLVVLDAFRGIKFENVDLKELDDSGIITEIDRIGIKNVCVKNTDDFNRQSMSAKVLAYLAIKNDKREVIPSILRLNQKQLLPALNQLFLAKLESLGEISEERKIAKGRLDFSVFKDDLLSEGENISLLNKLRLAKLLTNDNSIHFLNFFNEKGEPSSFLKNLTRKKHGGQIYKILSRNLSGLSEIDLKSWKTILLKNASSYEAGLNEKIESAEQVKLMIDFALVTNLDIDLEETISIITKLPKNYHSEIIIDELLAKISILSVNKKKLISLIEEARSNNHLADEVFKKIKKIAKKLSNKTLLDSESLFWIGESISSPASSFADIYKIIVDDLKKVTVISVEDALFLAKKITKKFKKDRVVLIEEIVEKLDIPIGDEVFSWFDKVADEDVFEGVVAKKIAKNLESEVQPNKNFFSLIEKLSKKRSDVFVAIDIVEKMPNGLSLDYEILSFVRNIFRNNSNNTAWFVAGKLALKISKEALSSEEGLSLINEMKNNGENGRKIADALEEKIE